MWTPALGRDKSVKSMKSKSFVTFFCFLIISSNLFGVSIADINLSHYKMPQSITDKFLGKCKIEIVSNLVRNFIPEKSHKSIMLR